MNGWGLWQNLGSMIPLTKSNLYNIIRFNVTLNSNFFPMLTLNLDKHQLEREIVKYERAKKWVTKKCVREREREYKRELRVQASKRASALGRERVSEPLFWVGIANEGPAEPSFAVRGRNEQWQPGTPRPWALLFTRIHQNTAEKLCKYCGENARERERWWREAEGRGDYWGREKEGVFTAGWNLFFNTEIKSGSASERKCSIFWEG